MKKLIYLDNSATTKPCEAAIGAVNDALRLNYGNPSSLYLMGMEAENVVSYARNIIAENLSAGENEIYFTSGGSESNNTAIFGAVKLRSKYGRHIVTTSVEHPSVLEPIKRLESEGYEVTYIKPDADGNISSLKFSEAIREDTVLVSVMYVNNETGCIFPVEGLKKIIESKNSKALLHIDAVQAFGKLNIDVGNLGVDLLSASAHKIHGIKGAGALFVKKGVNLPPLILGGGQEKGLRSGTEAVPAIAAFGAAAQLITKNNSAFRIEEIKNYCVSRLMDFENVKINSPQNAFPFILNFSFEGYRSETLLHFLEQQGICVSSGSACSKGKGSYVLREMGLPQGRVDSALRISFSYETEKSDIDALITALKGAYTLKKSCHTNLGR